MIGSFLRPRRPYDPNDPDDGATMPGGDLLPVVPGVAGRGGDVAGPAILRPDVSGPSPVPSRPRSVTGQVLDAVQAVGGRLVPAVDPRSPASDPTPGILLPPGGHGAFMARVGAAPHEGIRGVALAPFDSPEAEKASRLVPMAGGGRPDTADPLTPLIPRGLVASGGGALTPSNGAGARAPLLPVRDDLQQAATLAGRLQLVPRLGGPPVIAGDRGAGMPGAPGMVLSPTLPGNAGAPAGLDATDARGMGRAMRLDPYSAATAELGPEQGRSKWGAARDIAAGAMAGFIGQPVPEMLSPQGRHAIYQREVDRRAGQIASGYQFNDEQANRAVQDERDRLGLEVARMQPGLLRSQISENEAQARAAANRGGYTEAQLDEAARWRASQGYPLSEEDAQRLRLGPEYVGRPAPAFAQKGDNAADQAAVTAANRRWESNMPATAADAKWLGVPVGSRKSDYAVKAGRQQSEGDITAALTKQYGNPSEMVESEQYRDPATQRKVVDYAAQLAANDNNGPITSASEFEKLPEATKSAWINKAGEALKIPVRVKRSETAEWNNAAASMRQQGAQASAGGAGAQPLPANVEQQIAARYGRGSAAYLRAVDLASGGGQ